jgi:hypothetical protein
MAYSTALVKLFPAEEGVGVGRIGVLTIPVQAELIISRRIKINIADFMGLSP